MRAEEREFTLAYHFTAFGDCTNKAVHSPHRSFLYVNDSNRSPGGDDSIKSFQTSSSRQQAHCGSDGSLQQYTAPQQVRETGMCQPSVSKLNREAQTVSTGASNGHSRHYRSTCLRRGFYGTGSWSPSRIQPGALGNALPTENSTIPECRRVGMTRRFGKSSLNLLREGSREGGVAWEPCTADATTRGRSLSPLMIPLDPYRSTRTIVRAGTLVSRRDAAVVECASRRVVYALRSVSRSRVKASNGYCRSWSPQTRCGRGGWQDKNGRVHDHCSSRPVWSLLRGDEAEVDEQLDQNKVSGLLPSVKGIERELNAIKRADSAMREEQLAQVRCILANKA